ncbi:hypothetical protein ACYPKM_05470 [Pseudomonas aeruginosa]
MTNTNDPFFHGSLSYIEEFDNELLEPCTEEFGAGFYLTTSKKKAQKHADELRKLNKAPGRALYPTLHTVTVNQNNPLMSTHEHPLQVSQVMEILVCAPQRAQLLSLFGDLAFDTESDLLERAAHVYAGQPGPLVQTLKSICMDCFPKDSPAFLRAVRRVLGYDGVLDVRADEIRAVAWFPEQLQIVKRLHLSHLFDHEAAFA